MMGCFATGVTVVTSQLDGELHGMTANAVTSVSLQPLLVLVCVDKTADTHDILAQAGVFALSILSYEQEELSNHFAKKETEGAHRLDDVPHHFATTGSPIIDGCLAYLDCRLVGQHPGGDHTIFVGEVVEAAVNSAQAPLIFFRGRYLPLA